MQIEDYLNGRVLPLEDYQEYLEEWLNGLKHEMNFWSRWFDTKGLEWPDEYSSRTKGNRKFQYEHLVNKKETKLLDVGSGPCTLIGTLSDNIKLDITAVDPLAYAYNRLIDEHSIILKVRSKFGMVERLEDSLEENSFDIVHMQDALDHSYNPLIGISKMIYVAKVGGKIILNHANNEAENEHYSGLNQWNFEVKDDVFWIWRKDIRINVYELFKEYVDAKFFVYDLAHTVEFTKKNVIPLFKDKFAGIYNEKVFSGLLELLY